MGLFFWLQIETLNFYVVPEEPLWMTISKDSNRCKRKGIVLKIKGILVSSFFAMTQSIDCQFYWTAHSNSLHCSYSIALPPFDLDSIYLWGGYAGFRFSFLLFGRWDPIAMWSFNYEIQIPLVHLLHKGRVWYPPIKILNRNNFRWPQLNLVNFRQSRVNRINRHASSASGWKLRTYVRTKHKIFKIK